MLSLAYGNDQSVGGGFQAHRPEVCYPAQGFSLLTNREGLLRTEFGGIPVRRLSTSLGSRQEPVTYWINLGGTPVATTLQRRLIEVRLGLTGHIPDGLLFRLSSIDDNPEHAFKVQETFVDDLLRAVPPIDRRRLAGLDVGLAAR